jgi:hypothetical protein
VLAKKTCELLNPTKHTNNRDPSDPDGWLPHRYAEEEMRKALRLWLAEHRRQMTPTERAQSDRRAALRSKFTSKERYFGEP